MGVSLSSLFWNNHTSLSESPGQLGSAKPHPGGPNKEVALPSLAPAWTLRAATHEPALQAAPLPVQGHQPLPRHQWDPQLARVPQVKPGLVTLGQSWLTAPAVLTLGPHYPPALTIEREEVAAPWLMTTWPSHEHCRAPQTRGCSVYTHSHRAPSVGYAKSCRPKGHRFNSRSGHMPWLQAAPQ